MTKNYQIKTVGGSYVAWFLRFIKLQIKRDLFSV